MDERLEKYQLLLKLGDGYFEIHHSTLSTFMFEIFHNKRVFKNTWGGGPGRGRKRGLEGQDGRVVLW